MSEVDDVILAPVEPLAQGTFIALIRRAYSRIGELAERHNVDPPLTVRLVDANARCLLVTEVVLDEYGWKVRTGDGGSPWEPAIPFPWFLTLENGAGRAITIRVEISPCSIERTDRLCQID